MNPPLAMNLRRALEIGRAQRGGAIPLSDLLELLRLDQVIADAVLLQDLTWIDGEMGSRHRTDADSL